MKNKIIVALDVDDPKRAENLVDVLSPHVAGFKIGPRLTFRVEKSFLEKLSKGILFFDHKFFDIPSTTLSSVKVAAEMGATWVTVHGLNGPECLKELKKLETEIKKTKKDFRVVVVTVLTSFTKKNLPPIWQNESLNESVLKLARSAIDAGLESLVCSPMEINFIKEKWPNSFLIVPGIRAESKISDDQKRTATAKEAIDSGAAYIVVGRPIIESSDPVTAAKTIL